MFATFPSNLNVQTIHQSQVQHNEVKQITFDSITVKLSCKDAKDRVWPNLPHWKLFRPHFTETSEKYTFSIPIRMSNRFFEQRMNDLAKFLKEEVESVLPKKSRRTRTTVLQQNNGDKAQNSGRSTKIGRQTVKRVGNRYYLS